jgi:hypothetical protein
MLFNYCNGEQPGLCGMRDVEEGNPGLANGETQDPREQFFPAECELAMGPSGKDSDRPQT